MIYRLGYDFENTALISIDGVELAKKMPSLRPKFFAQPRSQDWVAPEATLYRSENFKGKGTIPPDVTTWSTGVLALSSRAYEALHELLKNAGEFLPISVEGEAYFLFNTLYIVPDKAVNKDKAVDIINSGVHFGQDNVAFDEEYLNSQGILVFKSGTDRLLHSYCTSEFRKVYDENGFKGLVFGEVVVS